MLAAERWHGYDVIGFLGDDDLGDGAPPGCPVLGPSRDAVEIARASDATGVLIATTAVDFGEVNRLTRDLTDAGFHVDVSSALYDIAPDRLFVQPLGTSVFFYVEPVNRHGWRRLAKQGSDIALATLGLVIAAPLFLIIALAIKVNSRGPVFFSQERLGKDGVRFRIFKFRTMVRDVRGGNPRTVADCRTGIGGIRRCRNVRQLLCRQPDVHG